MRASTGAAALLLAASAHAADYAVLIATSHTYGNYRHQADICHAYQVLTSGGVPASNIVTMMYDDIAHSSSNPFPGKIFNQPTANGVPGVDVYAGVKIDYKGTDVNSKNFLSVITGDASAMKGKGTGRVLTSGKQDRVFINMVDHGAPGFVAFPSSSDHLKKETLNSALQTMKSKGMFKQLVFYLEACESGSMFEGLSIPNVYATTAANAKESSYGTYCGSQAKVNGKNINSCLGDLYSVNWMQNADSMDLSAETLQQQYTAVKAATNKSHVMQYGDTAVSQDPAGDFEGEEKRNATAPFAEASAGAIDARDAVLSSLFDRYLHATVEQRSAAAAELTAHIKAREAADARFAAIAAAAAPGLQLTAAAPLTHRGCHNDADAAVVELCGGYDDYSLKYARTMVNLCEALRGDSAKVVAAVRRVCA